MDHPGSVKLLFTNPLLERRPRFSFWVDVAMFQPFLILFERTIACGWLLNAHAHEQAKSQFCRQCWSWYTTSTNERNHQSCLSIYGLKSWIMKAHCCFCLTINVNKVKRIFLKKRRSQTIRKKKRWTNLGKKNSV